MVFDGSKSKCIMHVFPWPEIRLMGSNVELAWPEIPLKPDSIIMCLVFRPNAVCTNRPAVVARPLVHTNRRFLDTSDD